jgi:hypothetical protein
VLSWLSTWLRSIDFTSDMLQVDYERDVTIDADSGNYVMKTQICRYANKTNLFEAAEADEQKEDLRVSYDCTFLSEIFGVQKNLEAKIVERYMKIEGEEGGSVLDLFAPDVRILFSEKDVSGELNLYSNYISFDKNVTEIRIPYGYVGSKMRKSYGDVYINSQETGYTSNEYLYLFNKSNAENYNGTMLYFEGTVKVYKDDTLVNEIEPGFYQVRSETKSASICDIGNPEIAPKLSYQELVDNSIYIDEDGSMKSAYVDSGFDTDEQADGGFGGGSVN